MNGEGEEKGRSYGGKKGKGIEEGERKLKSMN